MHLARQTNAAGLANSLNARGNIHAVADDVVAVDDHLADIDANAERHAAVFRLIGVARDHRLLDIARATDRIHRARIFDQQGIAGGADDAPAIFGDLGIDQRLAVALGRGQGAGLVLAHQARPADHIGRNDRRQFARYTVGSH